MENRWRWLCRSSDTSVSAEPCGEHEEHMGERLCWQLHGSLLFQIHHGAFQLPAWVYVDFFFSICISFYWYDDRTQVEFQAKPSDSPFCPWSVSVFVLHPHSLQRANWSRSWYGCCPPKSSWLGPPFTSCWSPNFVACLWKSVLAWWPPHSAFTLVHVVR